MLSPLSGGKTKIYYQRLSAASPTQKLVDAAIISGGPRNHHHHPECLYISTCVDLCNKINDILMKKNLT
jgi:hypothetical protein